MLIKNLSSMLLNERLSVVGYIVPTIANIILKFFDAYLDGFQHGKTGYWIGDVVIGYFIYIFIGKSMRVLHRTLNDLLLVHYLRESLETSYSGGDAYSVSIF